METTGQRIKRLRTAMGLSQVKLGQMVGASDVAIGYWERDINIPSSKALTQIAKIFKISESEILYGENIGNTENTSSKLKSIPILSWVQAGMFTESEGPKLFHDIENYIDSAFHVSSDAFALRVRGDSMFNPNGMPSIPEGSYIIVDPQLQPENGKIVVARIEGTDEATVKKLVIDGPNKYLVPLNPRYSPIQVNGNCTIVGVVKGVQYEF